MPVAVAGLALVPFLPALDGEFVHWDDDVNFVDNPHYRGLGPVQLRWMLTTTLLGHWIPLTWLTLGLNYAIGGMNPWGYHLGNMLLHAANAALVYFVVRRLLAAGFGGEPARVGATTGAAVAALVFAVHPLRVESVVWVTERRDVMCAAFYLLAVLGYLKGGGAGATGLRGPWRTVSVAAFAAALLSKSMAMTLPVTLLALDVYPLRRLKLGWRALVAEKTPYLVLAGAGAAVAMLAVSRGGTWTGYDSHAWSARLAMTGYSLWFYPSRLVWAEGLSPLYELPARVDPLALRFLGPTAAVVGVTSLLVVFRRRFPGGLAAWVHSMIVLAPVAGLVHAGHHLAHDRYSYLSGLGLAGLAGAGVGWTVMAGQRTHLRGWIVAGVLGAAGLAVLGWGAAAWRQTGIWQNSETLWRAAVRADDDCAICRNNLGAALMLRHPTDPEALTEAEEHLRSAIRLRPGYADPYRSLAALYLQGGRPAEAEAVLLTMVRGFPDLADGPTRLATLYAMQARTEEAIALLREALRRRPGLAAARAELSRLLTGEAVPLTRDGRAPEEATRVREAEAVAPPSPAARGARP